MITRRRSIVLTSRDLEILAHTLRFRMTTQEAVQRLFCPELAPEGVASILRRLREGGYLSSAHLYSHESYYHLTPQGAERVGHLEALSKPERAGRPLDGQGLGRAYAIFTFCCLQESLRPYINRYEMQTQFAKFWHRSLPQTPHYLHQEDGRKRLGFILVDYGHSYMRVVYRYSEAVVQRMSVEPLRKLIQAGGFIITLLTNLETNERGENPRALLIEKELNKRERHVECRIVGIPHLTGVGKRRTTRRGDGD